MSIGLTTGRWLDVVLEEIYVQPRQILPSLLAVGGFLFSSSFHDYHVLSVKLVVRRFL